MRTHEELVVQAEEQLSRYPQYNGKFRTPGWKRLTITRQVRTKFGIAFEKGDVVIGRFEEFDDGETKQIRMFAYSWRNKISTLIKESHFKVID